MEAKNQFKVAQKRIQALLPETIIDLNHKQTLQHLMMHSIKRIIDIDYYQIIALLVADHPIYKTLIIYNNNEIYYSPQSTKKIIQDMGNNLGMTYEKFVQKSFSTMRVYKAPYSYKNIIAIPEKGVAKGNVNWYFLGSLVGYDIHPKTETIDLLYPECTLKTRLVREGFIKQLQLVIPIYYRQMQEIKSWHFTPNTEKTFIYKQAMNSYSNNNQLNEWTEKY